MGLFDFLKRGKCTQQVAVESTLDAANGGVEAWFFTLAGDRQHELLVEMARRGLQATLDKYGAGVAIDMGDLPRHVKLYNGTNAGGGRGAGIAFLYFAEPAIAEAAARETFNHAAAWLHASQRLAR